jgi:hypothetical protein
LFDTSADAPSHGLTEEEKIFAKYYTFNLEDKIKKFELLDQTSTFKVTRDIFAEHPL